MTGVEVIFLGTGGGRFATITQKRRTGGIRIISDTLNMHLDPGPGALIYSLNTGLNPQKIKEVFVSHAHPDHYGNAEVLIEAMTRGMTKKRGILAASHSVLLGNEVCGPAISQYHLRRPKKVIETKPGTAFNIGKVKIITTEARHTDPDTVGLRLKIPDFGDIAYTSDSEFFDGIKNFYDGVRLLIFCVMRPSGEPWRGHMTTNDAITMLGEIKPEKVVITHFGMRMIFRGPTREAKLIEQKTGVPTIAAVDGMRINASEEIQVKRPRKQK